MIMDERIAGVNNSRASVVYSADHRIISENESSSGKIASYRTLSKRCSNADTSASKASRENLNGRQLLLSHSVERALSCFKDGEFGRAFAHFLVTFTIQPSMFENFLKPFMITLEKYTSKLKTEGRLQEALKCCEQILEIFPNHPDVLHELGSLFYRMDFLQVAAVYFQKAFFENPLYSHSLYCLENVKNAMIEKWHFLMLNDKKRNMAFKRAIEQAVKSGYTRVLDIGAGTGILSMMAVDSGAEKVYACEKNQYMGEVLRNVLETNGKSDSVHVLEKLSTDLTIPSDIPERVNLVVTETFDACLFGEHILKTLEHAWKELLCSTYVVTENGNDHLNMQVSAKVIPYSATIWAVPVECDRIREYARLNAVPSLAMTVSITEPYTSERLNALPGGYRFLSSPKAVLHVNFNDVLDIKKFLDGVTINLEYTCSNGILDAFVMWFDVNLDDAVMISSAPDQDGCWEQAVFYVLPEHLHGLSNVLQKGDVLLATFFCEGHMSLVGVRRSDTEKPLPSLVTCTPEVMYLSNFLSSTVIQSSELWHEEITKETGPVIDLSQFPLFGIRALQEGATNLIVFNSEMQNEVEKTMEAKNLCNDMVIFMPHDNYENCTLKAGLLFHHPVDMCGLLKKGIFETLHYLRMMCLKESAVVIPGKLEIFCTLIDSSALCKQTKLVSDENTVGYQISNCINIYQGLLHFDIDLSTLPYEKLCHDVRLCEIDLMSAGDDFSDLQGHIEVEIMRNGKIVAVPFWFVITYYKDAVVNTAESNSLYRVAASLPVQEVEVLQGDHVTLYWTCKNSCFYVIVNKMK